MGATAKATPARRPERPAAREPAPSRPRSEGGGARDEQRREQVGAEGLVAERLQDDRGQPREQRVASG